MVRGTHLRCLVELFDEGLRVVIEPERTFDCLKPLILQRASN